MGILSDIYINKDTNIKVKTFNGFSYPAFFFSMTWSFTKGLYAHGFIILFLKILPFLVMLMFSNKSFNYMVKDDDTYNYALIWNMVLFPAYIVFGLKGNDWVKENLVKIGYKRLVSNKQGSEDKFTDFDEKEISPEIDDISWNDINRKHHYVFAHLIFREQFFKNPSDFNFETISKHNNNPVDYLIKTWNIIGELSCNKNEVISPVGLDLEFYDDKDQIEVGLITLPKPKYMIECYFIAMILKYDLDNNVVDCYYFTLENSVDNNPKICAWDQEGSHINYGINIKPQKDIFLKSIYNLINNKS